MDYPIQEIFKRFYPDYLKTYEPTFEQNKVANDIIRCKTTAMKANVQICEDCGHVQIHYNSCRNRHYPFHWFYEYWIYVNTLDTKS